MFTNRGFFSVLIIGTFFVAFAMGIFNLQAYCSAFDANFKPIICILKQTENATNTAEDTRNYNYHPHHHRNPDYWQTSEESDEDECCCDLWCFPFDNLNTTIPLNLTNIVGSTYRCQSCGSECRVSTNRNSLCSCAVLGSSQNTTCTCNVLCASWRSYDDASEANCIFNVNGIMDARTFDERRPYTCDCRKSRAAENNNNPFFICACQRTS